MGGYNKIPVKATCIICESQVSGVWKIGQDYYCAEHYDKHNEDLVNKRKNRRTKKFLSWLNLEQV